MLVVDTAGSSRRTMWSEDLMSAYYSPPGIVFEAASEHDHDTDHPVAECRKEVGETLVDRHDHLRAFEDTDTDDSPDPDTASNESATPTADADRDTPGSETPDEDTPTERTLRDADYRTLQEIASGVEDVAGNQSEEELRESLLTHPEADAVRVATEIMVGTDDTDGE